jgi:hypothetical protein
MNVDYEESIDDKYMELVEEFVEAYRRQPRYQESIRLYDQARSIIDDLMCGRADDMRKREKGE